MNANDDLERRVAKFYATEAPTRAPDWLLESALTTIDTTKQRRAFIRVPWRVQQMNTFARLAAAAVAVIAIGAVGLAVLRPGTGPSVGGTSPTPTAAPTPSPTPTPTPSPPPSPLPALTETFTSAMNGISVSYPAGWQLRPATEAWPEGGTASEQAPFADIIYEKAADTPFIAVASQPLLGKSVDVWAADYFANLQCAATQPVTVDGATGVLAECGDGPYALVASGDRGYLIWLYRIDDPDWFPGILATVKLHPEDAVDPSPSASPSAS